MKQKVYNIECGAWMGRDQQVSVPYAEYTVGEVCKHFDLPLLKVRVDRTLGGLLVGQYSKHMRSVSFSSENPLLSTVLHECAHHLSYMTVKEMSRFASHGGAFAEAHLSILRMSDADDVAELLEQALTDAGLDLTAEAELARWERQQEARAKRQERERRLRGERGTVWVIYRKFDTGSKVYLRSDRFYTPAIGLAKTWRTRAAAERNRPRGKAWRVVEAEGTFVNGRWQADYLVGIPGNGLSILSDLSRTLAIGG